MFHLQNSLGGNSRTCLITCISPNEFNGQETLSSLRFGDRTQRIVNVAVSNEVMGAEQLQSVLDALHRKISRQKCKRPWRMVHSDAAFKMAGLCFSSLDLILNASDHLCACLWALGACSPITFLVC